jgi:DNA-binding response OmpR family regulator
MLARRARILVVEDDDSTRDMLADTLSDADYYVAGADRSAHALDAVRAQAPDLVILDLMMPEVDGVQVLTRIRGAGYTMPVLVVTGLAPPLAGFEGATAVLRKPFELDVFLATVARLLGPPEE